jgi:SAM-dependent methyltransferase
MGPTPCSFDPLTFTSNERLYAEAVATRRRFDLPDDNASFPAACPYCLRSLSKGHASLWRCGHCAKDFPACDKIPVLTREPTHPIAMAQTFVRQGLAHLRRLESAVDDATAWRTPARESLRARLADAIETNRSLLSRVAVRLPSTLLYEPEASPADALYQSFEVVMRYAVRDWSGQPWDEEQIQTIESSVARDLPRSESGIALVLGAGTCRIARDLTAAYGLVVACDLSLPMLLTYASIQDGPLRYADINFQNAESATGQVQETTLSVQPRKGPLVPRPERLCLSAADATRLPLPSESVSAVFSIYFSDVVPLNAFLPEVNRVLVHGGTFIHFGTLGYHRGTIATLLSAEDMREAIEAGGFRIEKERWVSTRDIGARPDRLAMVMLRNWLLVAQKTRPAAAP